jgi:hypothetical protein
MSLQAPSDQDQETVYEVEKVIGCKTIRGTDLFLVHWKGYDKPSDHTWEPIENLFGCLDLVEQFRAQSGFSRDNQMDDFENDELSDEFDTSPRKRGRRKSKLKSLPPKTRSPRSARLAAKRSDPTTSVEIPSSLEICDEWFTEFLPNELPPDFGKGPPKILEITQVKKDGESTFYECLFNTGKLMWFNECSARQYAPELVEAFLVRHA